LCNAFVTGIYSIARILLCRKPISNSCRQSLSRKEISNDVSSDPCLGTYIYLYAFGLDVDDPKFQNRRNRMKKEGQVLRKKAVAEGATLPLDDLYQRMEKFIVLEERKAPASPPSHSRSPTKQGNEMVSVISSFIFVLFTRSYIIDIYRRQPMQPTRTSGTLACISIVISPFMLI
jgi:hypothetical protein